MGDKSWTAASGAHVGMNSLDSTVVLGDHVLTSVSGELGAMCETLVTLITPQVLVGTVGRHVSDHLTARCEDLVTLVALRVGKPVRDF